MKRLTIWAGATLAVIGLFLLADPGFHSVEKRIYTQYTVSLVDDFDLNVVNQIPRKEAWLLSRTLNYPDVHSNGIVIPWSPFLLASKLIASEENRSDLDRSAQTIANVFWGLMATILLWLLLRRFYSEGISILTMTILLAASPYFWHLVYQPENADITSLFFSLALLHLYCERSRFKPTTFGFIFGLSFFAAVAVKFDIIFSGLLVLHWLSENRRAFLRPLLAFAAGSMLCLIPITINETLKFGHVTNGYLDTVTGKVYILYENLFAPSGLFYVQPFWLLFLIVAVGLGWKRKAASFYWTLLAIPVTELILESFNYNHTEGIAARHWINDLGGIALVLGQILTWLQGRKRAAFVTASFVLSAVFIASSLVYRLDFDSFYFKGDWWAALFRIYPGDYLFLITPHDLETKLRAWPMILISLVILGITWWKKDLLIKQPRIWVGVFFFLAASYAIVTAANIVNNVKSAERVPDRVQNAVIGAGPHINSFFENAGCLQRAIEYYSRRGEPDKALHRRQILEEYVKKAASEIVSDPVNFKATLAPGQDRYVPEELWNEN